VSDWLIFLALKRHSGRWQ